MLWSPDPVTDPLAGRRNVVLTPHLAGTDQQSLENMGIECAESIVALHQGRWPEGYVVNNELRETWKW